MDSNSAPANMAAMTDSQNGMFQWTPVNEEQGGNGGRKPRWSDDEDKTLCELLKTQ
jgi:hypothetical protein